MKTLIRGAAIGLALALGAQVAQAQAGLSLGLGAGAVIPTGSMADVNSMGWTGQAVASGEARREPARLPGGRLLQPPRAGERPRRPQPDDRRHGERGVRVPQRRGGPSVPDRRPRRVQREDHGGWLRLERLGDQVRRQRRRRASISSSVRPRCTPKAASTRSSRARWTPRPSRRRPRTWSRSPWVCAGRCAKPSDTETRAASPSGGAARFFHALGRLLLRACMVDCK